MSKKCIALALAVVAGLSWGAGVPGAPAETGESPAGTAQAPLEVTTATGAPDELRARDQLLRLVEEYDLDRWLFTRRVVVEAGTIPHSHPVLTVASDSLDDDLAQVATFVHEQFHWWVIQRQAALAAAVDEYEELFPAAPDRAGGGARSRESSWLHLVVCDLELQALEGLVGEERARQVLAGWSHYPWVYQRVLDDPRIREINTRHGFTAGAAHRQAVRIELAGDTEAERRTAARLEELLETHDVSDWIFTRDIVIDETAIPHSHPVLTVHTRHLGDDSMLLSTFLHEQFHWLEEEHSGARDAAMAELREAFPDVPVGRPEGARDADSTYLHLLVCDLEYQAMSILLGADEARRLLDRITHYTWIYDTVLEDPRVRQIARRHGFTLEAPGR